MPLQHQGGTLRVGAGACTGTGPCNITMTQNMSVTATFSQQTYLLTVSTNGSGTVTSTDGGINCPGTCGNSYPVNTPVTLNATPAPGWSFAGWSGACSGTGSCTVTMTQDQSVTATFTQNPNFYSLTVSISGAGTVTSTDMRHQLSWHVQLHLCQQHASNPERQSRPGGAFSGWSGACSGTGSCTVTMTQNLSVTATFTGQQDMVVAQLWHWQRRANSGCEPDLRFRRESLWHHLCGRDYMAGDGV